jgi:hypothetical protein
MNQSNGSSVDMDLFLKRHRIKFQCARSLLGADYGECLDNIKRSWNVENETNHRWHPFGIRNLKESKPVTLHIIPMGRQEWLMGNTQARGVET